jgi:hypothetical protein
LTSRDRLCLVVSDGPAYGPAMKQIALACLWLISLVPVVGQQGGEEPKRQVPQYLAKVPAQSDFFGSWIRQDGTYRLKVIRDAAGKVTATYLNPDPIKVESATFTEKGGFVILEVVLRDEGYPGSTYELTYDASYRILVGEYLMPQSGQRHQVYFSRSKD